MRAAPIRGNSIPQSGEAKGRAGELGDREHRYRSRCDPREGVGERTSYGRGRIGERRDDVNRIAAAI
jgi:hypothetical protein